jgi:hypothetical protein
MATGSMIYICKAPTKLVQHSACLICTYRGTAQWRNVVSSDIFNTYGLAIYRSTNAVGREGAFYLIKMLLPAFTAATRGGGGGEITVKSGHIAGDNIWSQLFYVKKGYKVRRWHRRKRRLR